MKYYQAFYNASECGLSGTPGFGIRTATAGIPDEYLRAIERDAAFTEYLSGDFKIPANEIFDHPDRILEYPRTYFHKILSADGKPFHVLGRMVSICFDYPFYQFGEMTRSGNLVRHLLVFEELPQKEYFDILYEKPETGSLRFLPADYRPFVDNPELRGLTLGKPEMLPSEEKSVCTKEPVVSGRALSLYFQLLEIMDSPKPIVVRAKEEETASMLAGALRLMDSGTAGSLTFTTNHQLNGIPKDVKLAFINEHYVYQVYPTTCEYIDLMDGLPAPTRMETIYRSDLEEAVREGNTDVADKLCRWISTSFARSLSAKPKELILSLFHYAECKDLFTLEDVDLVEGLLPELKDWIGNDADKAVHINHLLSEEFRVAQCLDDWLKAIELSEKIRKSGIPVNDALPVAKQALTGFLLSDIQVFSEVLGKMGRETLIRYADVSRFPKLSSVLDDILGSSLPDGNKQELIRMLEPDAEKRVEALVALVQRNPSSYPATVKPYLDADKSAADKVDWVKELKQHRTNPAFAELFYTQLVTYGSSIKASERVAHWAEMVDVNPEFGRLLFSRADKEGTYASVFNDIARMAQAGKKACSETADFVERKVLDVIPSDLRDRPRWELLVKVLRGETDVPDVEKYYQLASNLGIQSSVRAIAPKCLSAFRQKKDIMALVHVLLSNGIMEKDALVKSVSSFPDYVLYFYWDALVKETGAEGYDAIASVGRSLGISRMEVHLEMKERYPKEYAHHQRQKLLDQIKGFFVKKESGKSGSDKRGKEKGVENEKKTTDSKKKTRSYKI